MASQSVLQSTALPAQPGRVVLVVAHSVADLSDCTFIIPCLNEQASIAALTRLVSQLQFASAKALVIDGGSSDNTASLLKRQGIDVISSAKGRAVQMNAGAKLAETKYLAFLHADTGISQDFIEDFSSKLETEPKWGFCRIRLSGDFYWARIIGFFMNLRSGLTRVATGDQMLFVQTSLFKQLDGFANLPLMEDIEICKRLRKQHRPTIVNSALSTSSRRWQQQGVIRTVLLMWQLRLLYVLGVSPDKLHRRYYG